MKTCLIQPNLLPRLYLSELKFQHIEHSTNAVYIACICARGNYTGHICKHIYKKYDWTIYLMHLTYRCQIVIMENILLIPVEPNLLNSESHCDADHPPPSGTDITNKQRLRNTWRHGYHCRQGSEKKVQRLVSETLQPRTTSTKESQAILERTLCFM